MDRKISDSRVQNGERKIVAVDDDDNDRRSREVSSLAERSYNDTNYHLDRHSVSSLDRLPHKQIR